MRIGFGRCEIVGGHDLDVLAAAFCNGAQHIAADPAKPIDGDATEISGPFRIQNDPNRDCAMGKEGAGRDRYVAP